MEFLRTNELNKAVTNFTKKFGCNSSLGLEFCYYDDYDEIEFSLFVTELADETWTSFVKENFNFNITNIFMFSLLHEIGHHLTYNNFSQKIKDKDIIEVEKIEKKLTLTTSKKEDRKLFFKYYNLPTEKVATEWAVNFYKNNRRMINYYYKNILVEIEKFYIANNIE